MIILTMVLSMTTARVLMVMLMLTVLMVRINRDCDEDFYTAGDDDVDGTDDAD